MKAYGKLLLIILGIPGLIIVLMASTQALESSTDPSPFLDFVTDTIGDTADVAMVYAKFELCPVSIEYADPIDTTWNIIGLEFRDSVLWDGICGFTNSGCVITNILYHVDASAVPWYTTSTPPVEVRVDKFLLWAITIFREHYFTDMTVFWPGADKTICVLDTVANEDDYVTEDRFFNPLASPPYPHMDDMGMNLQPSDSFWVGLLFQAPDGLSDYADTVPAHPDSAIILNITAEPAASR